nr:hypothetical protein [Tanacetum cinerariifolium]
MLAPRSAKAKHSAIPRKSHGIRNLPGSPSFSAFSRFLSSFLLDGYGIEDFRLDNLRLDVFSASVVSRIQCVLCRLLFIFHHLRKKRRRRLKNPPLKHLVFKEPELDKQELGKLEVGKPRVDKQEQEEN